MGLLFSNKLGKSRIHLDYASTTPVHKDVLKVMLPYFNEHWANPSAIYEEGVQARKAVECARVDIARTLRVRAEDITFTSGGTESNNLALIGFIEALHEAGQSYEDMEIISTYVEHPSVLETLAYLEKRGVCIAYVPVTEDGLLQIQAFEKCLNEKTVLVTVAYANSETGVVQDIKKITRSIRAWNNAYGASVCVHTDASQAPLWLPCALDQLGVDMMTLDAGKCYGPKGIGILAHRNQVRLTSSMHGGGQEDGLRSGTENTALIMGGAYAIVRAQTSYEARSSAATKLREYFFTRIAEMLPQAIINGSRDARIANNINISLIGFDTEYAVIWLDSRGVAASTKSACGTASPTGSRVVHEMTHDETRATATLRFTLGEETTRHDIDRAVTLLAEYCVHMTKTIHMPST